MSSSVLDLLQRAPSAEEISGSASIKEVLNGLGVRPFTPVSVGRYKEQVAKDANRFLLLHRLAEMIPSISFFAFMLWYLCVFILTVVLVFGGPGSWATVGMFFCGMAISLTIFIFAAGFTVKDRGSWSAVPFEGYAGVIPEFALLHAMEIKANFPEAQLSIHQFVQDRRVLDPFLAVRDDDGADIFIDVWYEPKFDARQTI